MSLPTQYRVYRLLRDGQSMVQAARTIGITRQSVQGHVRELMRVGALMEDERTKSPKMFKRGARAGVYERLQEAQASLHGGRASPADAVAGCRVHRGSFKIEVHASPPDKEPAWENVWPTNGAMNSMGRFTVDGHTYTVRHTLGRRRASLVIAPAPMMVSGPAEVAGIEAEWMRRAKRCAEHFRAAYGYGLIGGVSVNQPIEYAYDMPGAPKVGRAGQSPFWTDGSSPTSATEGESQDAAWAVSMARLPEHQQEQDMAIRSIEARVGMLGATVAEYEQQFSAVADVLERQARAMSAALRAQVASAELALQPEPSHDGGAFA